MAFLMFFVGFSGNFTSPNRPTLQKNSDLTATNLRGKSWKISAIDEQKKRLQHIRDVCALGMKGKVTNMIFMDRKIGLTYCPVQKSGCTFWKRIFRYFNKERLGLNINSPSELSRHSVHFESWPDNVRVRFDPVTISNTTRMMFVRDPYARLWSAYLDKFYLPDFWYVGKEIARRRPRPKKHSLRCGHDITFREFIHYALSSDPKSADGHWLPIVQLCDPCQFLPNFVGKVEHFNRDAKEILRNIGQGDILNNFSGSGHVKDEISLLVDDYFLVFRNTKKCLKSSEFKQRIWTLFQYNGYIPNHVGLPEIRDKEHMKEVIMSIRNISTLNQATLKKQRYGARTAAFRSLPVKYLERIQKIFAGDFLLFDYDPKPKDIYKNLP
ncbi:hypothetical protein SNE40_012421 [Patella caerulea]|uniref:Carbohydrate sulfotransferase n=1 Tax=Patella caerulea TaxID=87958 RepID=A0AAN8JSD6_PATCE